MATLRQRVLPTAQPPDTTQYSRSVLVEGDEGGPGRGELGVVGAGHDAGEGGDDAGEVAAVGLQLDGQGHPV